MLTLKCLDCDSLDRFDLLRRLQTTEAPTPVAQPTPLATLPSLAAAPLALPSDEMNTTDDFEYSDVKKTACLLCQRQLKSIDLLRKHNAASDLHKVPPLPTRRDRSEVVLSA